MGGRRSGSNPGSSAAFSFLQGASKNEDNKMVLRLTKAEQAALSAEMRRIGSLGGQATARNMSAERRRERALKGVKNKAAKLAAKLGAWKASQEAIR